MQHSPKYKINLETKVRTTFFKFLGHNYKFNCQLYDTRYFLCISCVRVLNGSFRHKYLSNYNF